MVRFVESAPGDESGVDDDGLAPVIPLFGVTSEGVHGRVAADEALGAFRGEQDEENARQALLKRLRARSLSVREARELLRGHELDESVVERILSGLRDYGYLDDASLAEQIVHVGVDRKSQGRQAIAQMLAKRGIPRDVAEGALGAMPDDDAERALEFARTKARSMLSLDRDTAVRRLVGQLARRGYGGSIALDAARRALDETAAPRSSVRFR